MKNNSSRSGFTLVELLVVIAIIAILASVITVAASGAINAAKRAKAGNMANQIQTAILAYNTEYGVYPLPSGQTTDLIEGAGGTYDAKEKDLFFALCGNVNPYSPATPANNAAGVSNTRNLAFLTPKRTEVDPNGVVYNLFTSQTAPQYYSIAMDGDYSGVLGDSGTAAPPDFSVTTGWTPATTKNVTQPVAVWACCDPTNVTTPANSTAPNLWVHTN